MPQEGVYFYGGKDKAGNEGGKLWLLKVYQIQIEFVECKTLGKPPKPRYGHCLHQIENSNYLLLFGGRNDHFFKIFSHKCSFFEVDMLNVDTSTWIKVNMGGYKPESRFSFCSSMSGTRLYVFGGLGDNNYIHSRMEKLELDFSKVDEIIRLEKKIKHSTKREVVNIRDEDLIRIAEGVTEKDLIQAYRNIQSPNKSHLRKGTSAENTEEDSKPVSQINVGFSN